MESSPKVLKALEKAKSAGISDVNLALILQSVTSNNTDEKSVIKAIKNATKAYKQASKVSSNDTGFAMDMALQSATTDKDAVRAAKKAASTYKKALKASGGNKAYAEAKAAEVAAATDQAELKAALKDAKANYKAVKAAIKAADKAGLSAEDKAAYVEAVAASTDNTNKKVIKQLTKDIRKENIEVEDAVAVAEAVEGRDLSKDEIKEIVKDIKNGDTNAAIDNAEDGGDKEPGEGGNQGGNQGGVPPVQSNFSVTESLEVTQLELEVQKIAITADRLAVGQELTLTVGDKELTHTIAEGKVTLADLVAGLVDDEDVLAFTVAVDGEVGLTITWKEPGKVEDNATLAADALLGDGGVAAVKPITATREVEGAEGGTTAATFDLADLIDKDVADLVGYTFSLQVGNDTLAEYTVAENATEWAEFVAGLETSFASYGGDTPYVVKAADSDVGVLTVDYEVDADLTKLDTVGVVLSTDFAI